MELLCICAGVIRIRSAVPAVASFPRVLERLPRQGTGWVGRIGKSHSSLFPCCWGFYGVSQGWALCGADPSIIVFLAGLGQPWAPLELWPRIHRVSLR